MFDIRTLCECLDLHHSVYYYHQNHTTNIYKESNQKLDAVIKKVYDESKGKGINVSKKRVARRMKFLGLKSIVVKKFNHLRKSKSEIQKNI